MRPNPFKRIAAVILVLGVIVVAVLIIRSSLQTEVVKPVAIAPVITTPARSVIGQSVEGRDIDAYTFVSSTIGSSTKKILFVGGIHGGYEWNSVLLAYTFLDYLNANPSIIPSGMQITVIPSANPDAVFRVTGKEGKFKISDVTLDEDVLVSARFNADKVDLNRNFDCKWKPQSTWQSKKVSGGTAAFSEPEAEAIKNYVSSNKPDATVFWHSQSNAVYASQCEKGILPGTLSLMNAYAKASGYPAVKTFDAYATTGAADDWMASVGLPAITVELSTHNSIEWDRNLKGIEAVLKYLSNSNM